MHVAEERRLVRRHRFDDERAQLIRNRAALELSHEPGDVLDPRFARNRRQARFDEVRLALVEHDRRLAAHQLAHVAEVVLGQRQTRPPARDVARRAVARLLTLRTISGTMSASGNSRSARPACTIVPGMPQTTDVAWSCTITRPPAS